MSVIMGVMIVVMVIGFFGFGHHHMMGGHGKDEQKQEMMEHNHKKDEISCPDCPNEPEPEKKNIDDSKSDEPLTE